MKKILFRLLTMSIFVILSTLNAYALNPVLNFSDIVSGPKTGLGDGKGSGAIVTVWGNNLGSSKGNSKIYVGGVEAFYVYYWGNADRSATAGPADLYTYHKMQTISFSIAAGAADGLGDIHVVVNGATSNTLPFTVRPGRILHIKTTGTNVSTSGSWTNPWQTMDYVANGPTLNPGDIIYVGDGVQSLSSLVLYSINGTATNPISFIAYPGAIVLAQGEWGIANRSVASTYVNFSKFVAKAKSTGIEAIKGMRIVANEITNYPGGCADGQSGAVSGSSASGGATDGGIKAFGNYIHEFGCDTTTKLHHVFYISNRSGVAIQSFELGWNYLANNKAHHALHTYDEGICGGWTGTMLIHDNVVVNQVGVGVGIASACYSGYPYLTMPVEIYNNLFINVGLETTTDIGGGHNQAISLMKSTTLSHVKIYNNTIYGYGIPGSGYALQVQGNGSADWNFGGTWEFVNNIVVDTNNLPYEYPTYWKPADIHSNNLWYNGGDGNPAMAPSWDTAPITLNPQFVNPNGGFFNLQKGSPAINAGTITRPTVLNDIIGTSRSLPGRNYDIGAFQYINTTTVAPSAPSSLRVQ